MKKLLLSIFFSVSIIVFSQDGIAFQHIPFKDLLAKAKKENKLIFIDAMAVWCGPCKMMDKNVFPQKTVGDFYNKKFINAKFDMEKGEGRELAIKYGVTSYPTFLFINGDGQLISKNSGMLPSEQFIALGQEAFDGYKNFGSMRERFEKGEKDPVFLVNIIKLYAQSDYEFAKKASERYFQHKKDQDFTKEEVYYLLNFVKSADDANYQVFQKSFTAIEKHYPKESLVNFDNSLKMQKIIDSAIDKEKQTINDDYFLKNATSIIGEEGAKISLMRLKMNYFEMANKFPEFEQAALQYYKDPDTIEPRELLRTVKLFANNANDQKSLKAAEYWAETLVRKLDNAETTLFLTKIYIKTGKKELAKSFAESSLQHHQKLELDSTEIKELLKQLQ